MSERFRPPVEAEQASKTKKVPEKPTTILGALSNVKKEIAAVGTALALGGVAVYSYKNSDHASETRTSHHGQLENTKPFRLPAEISQTYFDQNPDYFKKFTVNGGFTPEERARRITRLNNGSVIFRDVGMSFYQVQAGDTLSEIREILTPLPEYSYLKDQTVKLKSFNIPARELKPGMWLPIPIENEDRHLTDEQFARYATKAIEDLKSNPHYSDYLKKVLDIISERELIATMVALAKQESGGAPIGQLELHRWEPKYHAFSYSIFHILMEKFKGIFGPGLKARQKLNFSEGQVYHPYNAVKLFIGYLKEKHAKPSKYFPIIGHAESFASMYNGSGWKKINPDYIKNITHYHDRALAMLETLEDTHVVEDVEVEDVEPETIAPIVVAGVPVKPPVMRPVAVVRPPAKEKREIKKPAAERVFTAWETVGGRDITSIVESINFAYRHKTKRSVFSTDAEVTHGAKQIMAYLRKRFSSDTYSPGDRIGIGIDERGPFFKFEGTRKKREYSELIRIK